MTVRTYTASVLYHAPLVSNRGHTSEEPCYAHGVRRRSTPPPADPEPVPWPEVDVNQVVAYNVRQARELRGWTQRSSPTASSPTWASASPRRRCRPSSGPGTGSVAGEFDAHELLIFALVFDLPITWFFLPPAGDRRMMRATTRPVDELYARLLGLPHQLEELHARLREYGIADPTAAEEVVERLTGEPSTSRRRSYKHRRKEMMLALLDHQADDFDVAVEDLGRRLDHLRAVGIRGWVAEHTNDSDFARAPAPDPVSEEPGGPDRTPEGTSDAAAPGRRPTKNLNRWTRSAARHGGRDDISRHTASTDAGRWEAGDERGLLR